MGFFKTLWGSGVPATDWNVRTRSVKSGSCQSALVWFKLNRARSFHRTGDEALQSYAKLEKSIDAFLNRRLFISPQLTFDPDGWDSDVFPLRVKLLVLQRSS